MSAAVICDECGLIVKRLGTLHCAKAKTHANGLVYGADICKVCQNLFDANHRFDGWHLTYREQEEAK